MKWEAKQLPSGRWGIFLCKKYWKFKDKPVMYASSINKESAEKRVARMNNPGFYSNDEKCYTVGMERAAAKKKREAAKKEKEEEKKKRAAERAEKKRLREEAKNNKKVKK